MEVMRNLADAMTEFLSINNIPSVYGYIVGGMLILLGMAVIYKQTVNLARNRK